VGIDPHAAATLWPWLEGGASPAMGEDTLLAGANMPTFLEQADWTAYDHLFTPRLAFAPTGTVLDDTVLIRLDVARRLTERRRQAQQAAINAPANDASVVTLRTRGLVFADPGDGLSSVLVLAQPGVDPAELARRLSRPERGMEAAAAPAYLTALRSQLRWAWQIGGIAGTALLALALACLGSAILMRGPLGMLAERVLKHAPPPPQPESAPPA
jgi:hypothetical protein